MGWMDGRRAVQCVLSLFPLAGACGVVASPIEGGTESTGVGSSSAGSSIASSDDDADPSMSSTSQLEGDSGGSVGEDGTTWASSEGGSTDEGVPPPECELPDTAEPGVQHASCGSPLPDPLPPLPHVNFEQDCTPSFALWQDYACDDFGVISEETCDSPDCAFCVQFDGPGVCTYADVDVLCDGEGEVIGSASGGCWICAQPTQHARACCEYPDADFDCRHWPFAAEPGVVGQVCARHDDCEPGLQCSEPFFSLLEDTTWDDCETDADCPEGFCADSGPEYGHCVVTTPHWAGYGICTCPGTPSDEIVIADSCF
jgi:hypothetical protein